MPKPYDYAPPRRDRWAPGPWDCEPTEVEGTAHGFPTYICRGPAGAYCGYVGVPKSHPLFTVEYSEYVIVPPSLLSRPVEPGKDIGYVSLFCINPEMLKRGVARLDRCLSVYGGLTYSNFHDGFQWFGFDCAHAGDITADWSHPGDVYRDLAYVQAQVERPAAQLVAWSKTTELAEDLTRAWRVRIGDTLGDIAEPEKILDLMQSAYLDGMTVMKGATS